MTTTLLDTPRQEIAPRDHLLPRPKGTVPEWAEAERQFGDRTESPIKGPWRNDLAPYIVEPHLTFTARGVNEVVIKASAQSLKTQVLLNILGFMIRRAPDSARVVVPRDTDVAPWGQKKLNAMILDSPFLKEETTGLEDDLAGKIFQLKRMWIRLAGANSPADLAGDSSPVILLDEINKYPRFSGREANPIKLATDRAIAYWRRRKIYKVSTPTTPSGAISVAYEQTDRRQYCLMCPFCNAWQPLAFSPKEHPTTGQVRWPDGADPDDIQNLALAWYECGYCQAKIEERWKDEMILNGKWVPECEDKSQAALAAFAGPAWRNIVGYHISGLLSPWMTWSDIAAEFLRTRHSPDELMNTINSLFGEDWQPKVAETKQSDLESRRGQWVVGQVPTGTLRVTAFVDVQLDHFWYVIRAWGRSKESWKVRSGRLNDWADVEDVILHTEYPMPADEDGKVETRKVQRCLIDSGYRTNEVYEFCRKHRRVCAPFKGSITLTGQHLRATRVDRDTQGRPLKGGIILWTANVNYYKDELNAAIHTEPGDPGEWHLPERVSDEYLAQMQAEQKIPVKDKRTGRMVEKWEKVSERRANHLWDCEVGNRVAADTIRVYLLRREGERRVFQPEHSSEDAPPRVPETPAPRRPPILRRRGSIGRWKE